MHLDGLGQTDRLTGEPVKPGPQGQMFPLALLRVAFAWLGLLCLYMSRVSTPLGRIIFRDPKGLQQGFELPNTSSRRRPNTSANTLPLRGSIACHSQRGSFFRITNDHLHLIRMQQGGQTLVDTAL